MTKWETRARTRKVLSSPEWIERLERLLYNPDQIKRGAFAVTGIASVSLVAAALCHRLPFALDPAQAIGILLGAWNTWLTAERSLWNWPLGIAGCLIFAGVFFHTGLYGAMGMQIFYASISIVGWRWWLRGGRHSDGSSVTPAPPFLFGFLCVCIAAGTPALALFLSHLHDAAPIPDALAATLNLVGQYLVMRKIVENWYFWIAGDLVSIVLYSRHGLPLFGMLYLIHAIMCAYGLWRWRRASVSALDTVLV
jgi:nicotinamide mononucleotide transporter